ncbi:carbohydrate kinase [Geminicoccaceae bacterium 1502E]|nr:carbohydrate kinase [Geminicoccaceae bacterium 1502E]
MFVVCGEALWDLFAVEGEGLRFDARPGGSPFNVAIGLARLDIPVAFFGGFSTGSLGGRLRALLRSEGVDTGMAVLSDRLTTLSLIELGQGGLPEYAFYGEGAADRAVETGDLPDLEGAWGVHFGSFSLMAEPVGSALLALARREAGRRLVTLDPNVRMAVEPDPARWRDRIEAFLATSDLAKVSAEDLSLLYPREHVSVVAQRWLAVGPALVVVTRGADGAEAHGRFGHVAIGGQQVVEADTVGAGDSFMAALIAWLAGQDITGRDGIACLSRADGEALLAFATAAAAITCSRRGADLPRRAELETPGRASPQEAGR